MRIIAPHIQLIICIVLKKEQLRAVGKKIQELRSERNLTQAEVAERCDLTINYIGKVERGEAHPTLEVLFSIATALKTNLSTLFIFLDHPLSKEDTKKRIRELLDQL